ncbi:MAG TPA: WXG100 family type VII secretion target [Jatrophihabitans sp.]|jgi:WXG100 family type VII secretion target|nr:WXG100 family type VII secretion target [Jatrophihabitans sp.]
MGGYAVDPGELHSCDVLIGDASGQSRAALGRLRAAAHELLGGGWRGAAAAAFGLGWEQWLAGAETMLDALDEMALAVGRAGREYQSTEDAVRAGVARTAT